MWVVYKMHHLQGLKWSYFNSVLVAWLCQRDLRILNTGVPLDPRRNPHSYTVVFPTGQVLPRPSGFRIREVV